MEARSGQAQSGVVGGDPVAGSAVYPLGSRVNEAGHLEIAGCDVLRDEAEAYAARLGEAAVPVDVLRYPGELHGFWSYGAVSEMPRLVDADVRDCLRRRAAQPRVT